MVTKLGKLECGNYGEDTLTASKLDDGSVVIERTNKDGTTRRWTIGGTDTLRVSGDTFGDSRVACMETLLVLVPAEPATPEPKRGEVGIAHFEINSQWGGTFIDEVAVFARAVAAVCGCSVMVIEPPPEPMPAAPQSPPPPARTPAPPPPPKIALPVRPGAAELASLATSATEQGLVRVLRVADGSTVLEDAFSGEAWTINASDELLLTVWGLSPGSPDRTVINLSRGDEELPRFYVWNDPTRGLHQAQVVELVKKIADLAGCRLRVDERWD